MRFAFFSPPLPSHLAVHEALAEALRARGHECCLVAHPEVAPMLRNQSLTLLPVFATAWSPASVLAHARRPGLPFGVFQVVRDMAAMTRDLARAAPALLREAGIDAVVSDQMESAGALVAEHLRLPFVTVAAAVPVNRDPDVPLSVLDWPYEASDAARKRNRGGERVADLVTRRLDRTIEREARRLGCGPKRRQSDCVSPYAELSQLLPGFDFPRTTLSPWFHYVGPIRGLSPTAAPMPEVGPGAPFVFMSLGTMQGHRFGLFRRTAAAARRLGFRLMVAHCGGLSARQAERLDADWVVDRVDQGAAVRRADLVVSHGGLNTVMDALGAGTPMLCVPLAFDQPGLGARVARLGAGRVLSPRASVGEIASALKDLAEDGRYRRAAQGMSDAAAQAGGAERGAAVIEAVARGQRADRSALFGVPPGSELGLEAA